LYDALTVLCAGTYKPFVSCLVTSTPSSSFSSLPKLNLMQFLASG